MINFPRDITESELDAFRHHWNAAANDKVRVWLLNSCGATFTEMPPARPKIPAIVRRARARAR